MGKKQKKTGYSGTCPKCCHQFVGAIPNRCPKCNFPLESNPQEIKKGKTKRKKKKKNKGKRKSKH